MIIHHVAMKSASKSSFKKLVEYITDPQSKKERVGKVRVTNCHSEDPVWAKHEITATQEKNKRAKGDKSYHLIISFAPGENPDPDILKIIEDRVVSSVGLSKHQRISAVHHDTDNLHIHLAINKIHPQSLAMVEPYRAYKKFGEVAIKIEEDFSLQVTNHIPAHTRSENIANDMEQNSGIESLLNWVKRHCLEDLNQANNWNKFNHVLSEHGLKLKPRGNGFVFLDKKGLMIKASSVSRKFSKKQLESRLGAYQTSDPTVIETKHSYEQKPLKQHSHTEELYSRYIEEMSQSKNNHSGNLLELNKKKTRSIEKAKRHAKLKRMALKLFKSSRTEKKILYSLISSKLQKDIKKIQKKHMNDKQNLSEKNTLLAWADWLQKKALGGDLKALKVLRYKAQNAKNKNSIYNDSCEEKVKLWPKPETVTKEGTAIYKVDNCTVKNTGTELSLSKGMSIDGLKQSIEMAQQLYGNCISVRGSQVFKNAIIRVSVRYKIEVTFQDKEMELTRENLMKQQEANNEHRRESGINRGTTASTSHGTTRANTRNRGSNRGVRGLNSIKHQSDSSRIRKGPPAKDENSLPSLSELNVVQLTGRSEVLLPNNAHDKLGGQRLKPDNKVRRFISRLKNKTIK